MSTEPLTASSPEFKVDGIAAHTALDVVTLGESMALLAATEPGPLSQVTHFTRWLAGAETNVAIGLARLGLRVGWLSRLGQDAFGDFVLDAVRREGVETTSVRRDPARSTGFMLKSLTVDGSDPAIDYYRRGSAASALSLEDWDAAWFARAQHLHTTGIAPALSSQTFALVEHAMVWMRSQGRTVSFDPNLRPRLWGSEVRMREQINHLARHADWVLPGLGEGQLLTGQQDPRGIARFYRELGAAAVIVKLGAEGCYLSSEAFEGRVPGFTVPRIVDTVGAGDGFAAGLISARLEGKSWKDAAARGNWVGAQAIQVAGDMDGLPLRSALPANV